jgi:ABC-type Fe3+-hydroxamate transport system substrate-binding protein
MFITVTNKPDITPKRIISLVPSLTELLWHLGLYEETVGITKFCIHPKEWYKSKTRVGGTKQVNIKKLFELEPDLIICNKEENVKEQIDLLAEKYPVFVSDISTYKQAIQAITAIACITNKTAEAALLIENIEASFEKNIANKAKITAAYLIWKLPYMTVGGDTYISDLMRIAGFENVFKNKFRYPETSLEELRELNPTVILLSSEPYPFKEKHIQEIKKTLPHTKILLVDGEMFSWYGSRMLYAAEYFNKLQTQIKLL